MDTYWIVIIVICAFCISFPLIWCFVVGLLSYLSGWKSLSKKYSAAKTPIVGEIISGVTGMVGPVSYRYTLAVSLNDKGFFIEVIALFRFAHPRLFIPWSDVVSRVPTRVLWWKAERLVIGDPKVGSISLPVAILEKHRK